QADQCSSTTTLAALLQAGNFGISCGDITYSNFGNFSSSATNGAVSASPDQIFVTFTRIPASASTPEIDMLRFQSDQWKVGALNQTSDTTFTYSITSSLGSEQNPRGITAASLNLVSFNVASSLPGVPGGTPVGGVNLQMQLSNSTSPSPFTLAVTNSSPPNVSSDTPLAPLPVTILTDLSLFGVASVSEFNETTAVPGPIAGAGL